MESETNIDKIPIYSCTVPWVDGEIDRLSVEIVIDYVLVMSPEQILYRDELNRENTATRMHQRMLAELSKQNGSKEVQFEHDYRMGMTPDE